jgi:hypothetical protein
LTVDPEAAQEKRGHHAGSVLAARAVEDRRPLVRFGEAREELPKHRGGFLQHSAVVLEEPPLPVDPFSQGARVRVEHSTPRKLYAHTGSGARVTFTFLMPPKVVDHAEAERVERGEIAGGQVVETV